MSHLIENFKKEWKDDRTFAEKVDQFAEYIGSADGEATKVIGLESKLAASEYNSLRTFALRTKERFYKKVVRYELYESGQKILAFVLADIHCRFNLAIVPLINDGASDSDIRAAIQAHIIDKTSALLEENVLDLFADELNGALFFLTGNCHIKWEKDHARLPSSV